MAEQTNTASHQAHRQRDQALHHRQEGRCYSQPQPGRCCAQALHGRPEGRRDARASWPRRRSIVAQEYAERAVLVPVGALLVARDNVVATVEGLRESVTSREKAEKELAARRKRLQADIKRYERRGRTERNRVERQVKKARTRVERELRQRRTRVEREIRSTRKDVARAGRPAGRPRREHRADGHHPRHAGRDQGPGARRQRRVGRLPLGGRLERAPAEVRLPVTYLTGRSSTSPPSEAARHRRAVSASPSRAHALCLNGRHAFPRRDPQGPRGRHRSRAAPLDRRARDGALDRRGRRPRAGHRLADDARLPDPQPLRDRRPHGGRRAAGVERVEVGFDVLSDQEKAGLQKKLGRPGGLPEGALAQVSNVVCIGSGKGGVGKSTITANLAAALTADGKRVGVLDADVWGYSIPRMFGVSGRPPVSPQRKIMPLEGHGVKVMSIGFFVEEDSAVVWRGPMLHKALTQFLEDVEWGELDFLLVDLPPGTGDVSMTLAQLLPQAKFLIVTTPQPVAQKVARRAAEMAHKVDLEIGGVIENMAGFVTPSGERFALFGEGGGQALADELDVPLLGSVPLTMPLREQADAGEPLVFTDPDDPASQAMRHAARGLMAMFPVELPILQAVAPAAPAAAPTGMSLPMAG